MVPYILYIHNKLLRKEVPEVDKSVDEYGILLYLSNKSKFKYDTLNITMLLTNNCNFRCTYCFQSHDRENNKMDEDTLSNILKFIRDSFENNKNLRNLNIILFGGEPLLKLDMYESFLLELKKYCLDKEIRYATQIVTNGSLINEKQLEILHDNNCEFMQITLDGVKEIHNKSRIYRNGQGTFDKIIEGIKQIKEFKKLSLPTIRINVDSKNHYAVGELLEFLHAEKLNDCFIDIGIIFESSVNQGDYNDSLNSDSIKGIMLPIWEKLNELKFNYNVKPKRRGLFCGAYVENFITIDTNGDLYKCWDVVKNQEFKIGNINEYKNIDNTKYIEWINRDLVIKELCQGCEFLPICGFGCANLSYERENTIFSLGCDKTR